MKAYTGGRGIAPLIHNLVARLRRVGSITPLPRFPCSILRLIVSWYRNSKLPCTTWCSPSLSLCKMSASDTQGNRPMFLLSCTLKTVRFPLHNHIHFSTPSLISNILLPEGRAGTAWKHTDPYTFSVSFPALLCVSVHISSISLNLQRVGGGCVRFWRTASCCTSNCWASDKVYIKRSAVTHGDNEQNESRK
jgi:hypothetical protein